MSAPRHTVTLSGMPPLSTRFPSRDEIQRAASRRDVAALADMDRRVRDALPLNEPVNVDAIYAGTDLLSLIAGHLRRLSSVGLSDHGDERARARRQRLGDRPPDFNGVPVETRLADARRALDGARQGKQPDADLKARADGVRRALEGGA